jgi:putative proteasome-type protease
MTLCLGMRCADGLIAIADTRLTSGELDYIVTGKKIFLFKDKKNALFVMFSGLKSMSDAVLTYLNEKKEELLSLKKVHKAVELIALVMREVREREEEWLHKGNMEFVLNIIVGGQYETDNVAKLFRIYPEGSWTRIRRDTPFEMIGETKYGKPILDRTFTSGTPTEKALLIGLLAFDSSWKSNPLVHPPIDVVEYIAGTYSFKHTRLSARKLLLLRRDWEKELEKLVDKLSKKKYSFFSN